MYKIGIIDLPSFYLDFEAWQARDPNYKSSSKDVKNILEDFFKEVTLMSKLSHPNILLFIGVCVRDNGDRFIITEMMARGSVFD